MISGKEIQEEILVIGYYMWLGYIQRSIQQVVGNFGYKNWDIRYENVFECQILVLDNQIIVRKYFVLGNTLLSLEFNFQNWEIKLNQVQNKFVELLKLVIFF